VSVALASERPDIVVVPKEVTVGFGGTFADFAVKTFAVPVLTQVMITATYAGLTRSAILTVEPSAGAPPPPPPPPPSAPTLTALAVNPATVVGGSASTGTVTLSAGAPDGGAVVSLSDNSTAVTVPANVTVAAGATGASFTITTTSVTASTSAMISAVYGGVTRTAALTVNPASSPPGQTAALTVTATGRSGERVTSTPTGINVAVGSTGSATFTVGTSITLGATNSRDVIWSGACSSGGNKTKTCTFTLNGASSVTANVQ